jgi:hypothetical protein
MKKYFLLIVVLVLVTKVASALPIIGKFAITNINTSDLFIPPNYSVATPFTGTVQLERSLNFAAPTLLEDVDVTLVIVYSLTGDINDTGNINLSAPLNVTASNFGSSYKADITISASLPPTTGGGRIMLVTTAYYYLAGVKQTTPVISYSTQQFIVPSLYPETFMAITQQPAENGVPVIVHLDSIHADKFTSTESKLLKPAVMENRQASVAENVSINNIYPNPTKGRFWITSDKSFNKTKILVIDALGAVVREIVANGTRVGIDLTSALAGAYFVKVQKSNGQFVTYKIIKQ